MWHPANCRLKAPLLTATALGVLAVSGCSERARLTFEPGSTQTGPKVFIDVPETESIQVSAGPMATVAGRAIDADGVDSLYVIVVGGNDHFNTITPENPTDTLRFILPISTAGLRGDTLTVLVYATDAAGTRGDTASRTLFIK